MTFSLKNLLNADKKEEGIGTFLGIFVPNITMMFGVILFFRISLVTAYLGFHTLLLIGIISLVFMLLTTLSASAIATNMQIKGGGIYFIASRSLGIEIGGALGLAIFLSQIFSLSLCATGFAYSIQELFPHVSLSLVEFITLVGLTLFSLASTNLALKFQVFIFGCLLLSLGSVFLGTGERVADLQSPLYYPEGLSFWKGFGIIFPAFTGIEVGMSFSDALKRPGFSISVGTAVSLIVSFATYMVLAYFLYIYVPIETLKRDPYILLHFSRWEPLVFLGIWLATLSSCLGSLLGAPRILQRLAEDGVVPEIFSRQFGPNNEPRYALVFTCGAALFFTFFTRIDQLIPMLSMIGLITYGSMNFAAFFGELTNSPSWRPYVRPPILFSFLGFFLALFLMFSISFVWAMVTLGVVAFVYILLRRRSLDVNFQDIRENVIFFLSKVTLNRLEEPAQHAYNWHPQLLTFVASPQKSEKLIHISHSLTRTSGILTYATLLLEDTIENEQKVDAFRETLKNYYQQKGITCYVETGLSPTILEGMISYVRAYGFGPMQPNTIVMGFPHNSDRFEDLVNLSEVAKQSQKNLLLFKSCPTGDLRLFKKRNFPKKKIIHLWWEREESSDFGLMLSYLSCLMGGIAWGGAHVTVHGLAKDEKVKGHLEDYFKEYLLTNRIQADYAVHLIENPDEVLEAANEISKDAHLIFLGLELLSEENQENYADYLRGLEEKTVNLQHVLFVGGYQKIDHSVMYHP